MSKNIGIKLADGTFYPIMEDGIPQKKLLELTTVQDGQTTVMVDLYRSESGTMADAEYVDTLQISNLIPHENGEPNICLTVQLDEDNMLSAEVSDPESGTSSSSRVELVTRAEDERQGTPDYTLSETLEDANAPDDMTIDDELAFADDAFPAEFADAIPADEAETIVSQDDNFIETNDSDLSESGETAFDSLPDFDDTDILQEVPESDPAEELGITEEFNQSDDAVDGLDSSESMNDFSLPSFDEPISDEENAAEDFFQDESGLAKDLPEFDIPPGFDTEEPSASETESLPDFDDIPETATNGNLDEQTAFDSEDETFSLPDFDDTSNLGIEEPTDSYIHESTLPDFSKFELPDFDDPVQNVGFATSSNSGLFDESDFDDPAFHEQPLQANSNAGLDFSGLYDEPSDNDFGQNEKKHRNTAAVVTCVICAIICLVVLIMILCFLPSQISIDISRKTQDIQTVETDTPKDPAIISSSDISVLPPQPEPKEDTIVIAETPAVVPVPPPPPERKPQSVMYKIKWGDTLWDLADSYYNNPWLYKKIAAVNNISNPDHIVSGTYISIPPK